MYKGLPKKELTKTSFFEFWPTSVIYLPVAIYYSYLAIKYKSIRLPFISNPAINLSGFMGESKSDVFNAINIKENLAYVLVEASDKLSLKELLNKLQQEKLNFPVVAKPNIGCRGVGVKIINNKEELQKYLINFPKENSFILQKKAKYEAEFGVLFVRDNTDRKGKVISITIKYLPKILGDGILSIKDLIISDPRASKLAKLYLNKNKKNLSKILKKGEEYQITFTGNHAEGAIFRNGNEFITKALETKINNMLENSEGINYCRFDIKAKSIEDLMAGENIEVMEINGASAEPAHIWDAETKLKELYQALFMQYRYLFAIGDKEKKKGIKLPTYKEILNGYKDEKNVKKFKWNHISK